METGLTVHEVANETGLCAHTIRYYERIGLIPPVERASNGHRRYSEEDVRWIEFLKCLRATGMPISEMQRYVTLQRQGDRTLRDRLALLEAHKRRIEARLRELNLFLDRIEQKIAWYQSREVQDN